MSLREAWKGAAVELAALPISQRPARVVQIARLFTSEILSTIAMAPYGFQALTLYNSLPAADGTGDKATVPRAQPLPRQPRQRAPPPPQQQQQQPGGGVRIARGVRYGPQPRATLDIYIPEAGLAAAAAGQPPQHRVVLFCHGGVWAAGETWHYAPMGCELARAGVMACVMQYTLYPDALVPQLVGEVGAALDWVLAHAHNYGGDASQIILIGHSAGAHLCMMALMHRAHAAHSAGGTAAGGAAASGGAQPGMPGAAGLLEAAHCVMPQQFLAIAGVYDISKHYVFEAARGVEELSTMKRAVGGFTRFAAMSPAVILAKALQASNPRHAAAGGPASAAGEGELRQGEESERHFFNFYSDDNFSLGGEAIAHRIGLDRPCSGFGARDAELAQLSTAGQEGLMDFPLAAAQRLPPTVLMSTCTDMTVPWYESAEMYWRLFDCGVPVKHLVYNKVGHGDFVVNWIRRRGQQQPQPAPSAAGTAHASTRSAADSDDYEEDEEALEEQGAAAATSSSRGGAAAAASSGLAHHLPGLPSYCQDILKLALGCVHVDYAHKPVAGLPGAGPAGGVDAPQQGQRASSQV